MDNKPTIIGEMIIGTRILYRSKDNWRFAVLSKMDEEKATLIVCSAKGRTYRLRRELDAEVVFDGNVPILKIDSKDNWRENFLEYDTRW